MSGVSPFKGNNFKTELAVYPELLGMPFKVNPTSTGGKQDLIIFLENLGAVLDTLVICPLYLPLFVKARKWIQILPSGLQALLFQLTPKLYLSRLGVDLSLLTSIINKSLGLTLHFTDLLDIGNRITLLERLFNTRAGLTSEDDTFSFFLPKRKDFFAKYRSLLFNYYINKGLTGTGLVSKQALEESGLLGLITI